MINIVSLFKDKPVIDFRRLPNLRDMLTNAPIQYPPTNTDTKVHKPPVCTRLGRCKYCPLINKINEVKCNFRHKSFQLKVLPKHITCKSNNVIYLISCQKCDKHYVGETSRAFRRIM